MGRTRASQRFEPLIPPSKKLDGYQEAAVDSVRFEGPLPSRLECLYAVSQRLNAWQAHCKRATCHEDPRNVLFNGRVARPRVGSSSC
jgi:hypothetical protein